jgi:K(+)-stimulated pyrophosphate-energized sodium pump
MPSVPPDSARWCCSAWTYTEDLKYFFKGVTIDFSLSNPYVVVGLLIGGLLPYLFGAMGMTAVGRAAGSVVEEVRTSVPRKARHHGGHQRSLTTPRRSTMLTRAAIKEMIIPSLLPVLSPIVLYFLI